MSHGRPTAMPWQAARPPIAITDQWLDRPGELSAIAKTGSTTKTPIQKTTAYQPNQADHPYLKDSTYLYFEDVASGYRIQQGLLDYSTRIYAFGDERANTLCRQRR
jgi:hypothetical protein